MSAVLSEHNRTYCKEQAVYPSPYQIKTPQAKVTNNANGTDTSSTRHFTLRLETDLDNFQWISEQNLTTTTLCSCTQTHKHTNTHTHTQKTHTENTHRKHTHSKLITDKHHTHARTHTHNSVWTGGEGTQPPSTLLDRS